MIAHPGATFTTLGTAPKHKRLENLYKKNKQYSFKKLILCFLILIAERNSQ